MNIPKSQIMRGCKLTNGYPLVLLNGGSTMMSLIDAHTKRLPTKRLLDKTSPNKTSPLQNVSVTKRLLVTKRLPTKRLLDKTSPAIISVRPALVRTGVLHMSPATPSPPLL
jgi:hypothetical protein